MPDQFETRALRATDIPVLAAIADETLFPGAMLGDMAAPVLAGQSDDLWRVVVSDETPVGFAMAAREMMTDNTWNLRAIAVAPHRHGTGAGSVLLAAMEAAMTSARLIVIDTTQLPDQERARRFYAARGYRQVSTIPGFFGANEDKVTFIKYLT